MRNKRREVRREILPGGDTIVWYDNGGAKRIETPEHKRHRAYFEQFDMFTRKHRIPERVCVLGPGIHAADEDAYDKITADYILAVNYAVLIPRCTSINWPSSRKIDAWLVSEYDVASVAWFKEMFKMLDIVRYFSTNTCVGIVDVPHPFDEDKFYTFKVADRPMKSKVYDPFECTQGRFHPDTTIIGVACTIAEALGAKELELCGCDLIGNQYYDGTECGRVKYTESPHPNADRLDSCLSYLANKKNVKIKTLSSTILKTPMLVSDDSE